MKKPSILETVAGSLPVTAGVTAFATAVGGATLALLPVLTSTLAGERHKKRVQAALEDINKRLSKIESFDKSLTDPQYTLINEIVLTILNTPDDEKIKHLKEAVFSTPLEKTLTMHDATVISRVLNAISIGELALLIECHGRDIIFTQEPIDGFYNIDKFSLDGERALGLINLGLLSRSPAEGTASDIGAYQFTLLADKLVNLIKPH